MKYKIDRDTQIIQILDEDDSVLLSFTFELARTLRYSENMKNVLMSIREMAIARYTEKIDKGLQKLALEIDPVISEYKNSIS